MQYNMIVKLIMAKGVENVQVPENIKFQVLTEAGSLLFKEGRHEEAGKALAKANNIQELLAAGDWLSQQGRFKDASYFYVYSQDRKRMESCAHACMNQGCPKEAKNLFMALENQNMLVFLQENFGV